MVKPVLFQAFAKLSPFLPLRSVIHVNRCIIIYEIPANFYPHFYHSTHWLFVLHKLKTQYLKSDASSSIFHDIPHDSELNFILTQGAFENTLCQFVIFF